MVGIFPYAAFANTITGSIPIPGDVFTPRTLEPGITSVQVGPVCESSDARVTNTIMSSITMYDDVLA